MYSNTEYALLMRVTKEEVPVYMFIITDANKSIRSYRYLHLPSGGYQVEDDSQSEEEWLSSRHPVHSRSSQTA